MKSDPASLHQVFKAALKALIKYVAYELNHHFNHSSIYQHYWCQRLCKIKHLFYKCLFYKCECVCLFYKLFYKFIL